jgi:hypothetical protein
MMTKMFFLDFGAIIIFAIFYSIASKNEKIWSFLNSDIFGKMQKYLKGIAKKSKTPK